jgi:nitrogen fixation protein NifU and related proteins
MSISDIFSQVLLDHYHHPRHYGEIDNPDVVMDGANPLCGDEIQIQVKGGGDHVSEIGFTGKACAICTASTSMFCEKAVGSKYDDLDKLRDTVHDMLHGDDLTKEDRRRLGDALAL